MNTAVSFVFLKFIPQYKFKRPPAKRIVFIFIFTLYQTRLLANPATFIFEFYCWIHFCLPHWIARSALSNRDFLHHLEFILFLVFFKKRFGNKREQQPHRKQQHEGSQRDFEQKHGLLRQMRY